MEVVYLHLDFIHAEVLKKDRFQLLGNFGPGDIRFELVRSHFSVWLENVTLLNRDLLFLQTAL